MIRANFQNLLISLELLNKLSGNTVWESMGRVTAKNGWSTLRCSNYQCCIIQLNLKMAEEIKVWTQELHPIKSQKLEIKEELLASQLIDPKNFFNYLHDQQFDNQRNNPSKNRQRQGREAIASSRSQEWTVQQENLLMKLHNEKGNKWVQIARALQRTDNSVKNHFHSKLRKALRKINKCLNDHLKTQCKQLKNNLLSRIIQTAENRYVTSSPSLKEEANCAFKLKNNILEFTELNQQQILPSQINRIRNLVSQIDEFNKKYKKLDRSPSKQKRASNKYKGKEITSLLSENCGKSAYEANKDKDRKTSESFNVDDNQIDQQQNDKQIIVSNVLNSNKAQNVFNNVEFYNPCDPFYMFKQYLPIYFSIYPPTLTNIFSGKPSSFTYYVAEKEKICEQITQTSIPRIQSDFRKIEASNETLYNAGSQGIHPENGR